MGDSVVAKKIGLRTIRLDRSKDKYGNNFCFYLNGVPIFGKGADWILPDSLMGRVTNETYDYYIDSALKANFNMLRIWGGAYYTPDYFLEQCDEKGLLIWQDFMFACLMYPFYEEDFLENVLNEIKYQIMRMKSHPSPYPFPRNVCKTGPIISRSQRSSPLKTSSEASLLGLTASFTYINA